MKIGVIGGGVWGSTLAKLLSNNKVFLFARDKKVIKSINEHHFNPKLKYAVFNDNITATDDLVLLNDSDYLFIALPSQSIREVLSTFKSSNANLEIIIASKGIEISTLDMLDKVVADKTACKNISVLSGPCFSDEVSQNLPTAVTFASKNRKSFDKVNSLFEKIFTQ